MVNRRIGFDGTKHTPSKELLKSTASSRSHRIAELQDMSMDQQLVNTEPQTDDDQIQQQYQLHPALEAMDEETSTVASGNMDDVSFDISLPSMNHHSRPGSSSIMAPPHSPSTPRMGCLDPVALTLLNDGKEDYHYLMTQDALFPIPKVEEGFDGPLLPRSTSLSSSASASPSCLSPINSYGQSPAEVRGTLSQKAQSTLARPVAVMARTGRVSPSQTHKPRLMRRPEPKHVR
jgi:hypothetical protein